MPLRTRRSGFLDHVVQLGMRGADPTVKQRKKIRYVPFLVLDRNLDRGRGVATGVVGVEFRASSGVIGIQSWAQAVLAL